MFKSINSRSTIAVYTQIQNAILLAIASGELKSGDTLPPMREVAEAIEVNINTVVKAYQNLRVMGVVHSAQRRGTLVAKDVETKCREQCRAHIIERLHEIVNEAKAAGMSLKTVKEICTAALEHAEPPHGDMSEGVTTAARKRGARGK